MNKGEAKNRKGQGTKGVVMRRRRDTRTTTKERSFAEKRGQGHHSKVDVT